MASCVLDASIAVAFLLPDEDRHDAARRIILDAGEAGFVVPPHWFVEIGNAMLMSYRRGRVTEARLPEALALIASFPFQVDRGAMEAEVFAEPLGRALGANLTLYDALYLEAAERLSLPLATFDAVLRRAAAVRGVKVLPARF